MNFSQLPWLLKIFVASESEKLLEHTYPVQTKQTGVINPDFHLLTM